MKIAIIGAGISGLMCAYRLSKKFKVSIFERENYVGGLCSNISLDNLRIEKYNHFFSRQDSEIIKVIQDLGLANSLSFKKVMQASIIDGEFFDMSRIFSLLCLPGVSIIEKIKLAVFLINVSITNDGLRFNSQSASEWIENNCSKNVFDRYFKPMLEFKFQNYADVSASYLWARIKEGKQNEIGVLSGGMEGLLSALENKIRQSGAKIKLSSTIRGIERTKNNKWILQTEDSLSEFDCIVCCISLKEVEKLCDEELKNDLKIPQTDYLFAASYIIKLKKPLSAGYWLFINHKSNGVPNIIINTSALTGDNLVYCPVYKRANIISETEKENIFKDLICALKNINPDFDQTWVEKKVFCQDTFVEPVLMNKFIDQLVAAVGRVQGLYLPDAIYERHLLKTVNTQAIRAQLVFTKIMEGNLA
ncbi:MAG: FAD-dependent oxidoreductase [Candidatus Omnitrophica bacterium]|nr:FAD-dependent oxidoreductase [Candidatus Omnitrophota bacterium]